MWRPRYHAHSYLFYLQQIALTTLVATLTQSRLHTALSSALRCDQDKEKEKNTLTSMHWSRQYISAVGTQAKIHPAYELNCIYFYTSISNF